MRYIFLFFIKIYQKTFSLDHGLLGKIFPYTRLCRFNPSCSQYAYDAVKKYGSVKGSWMGIKRLLRCNEKTPAGTWDPVE